MAWTSGGPSRTSTTQHRRFRRDVLRRDDYTCQGCGHRDPTGKTVQADEITPVAEGGTPDVANGQTLCTTCHDRKTQTEAAAGRARHSRRRPGRIPPSLTP